MSIETVAIVGCGQMGRGIAEACASAGLQVVAIKATRGGLEQVEHAIAGSLARRVSKGKLSASERDAIWSRITITDELDAVADCDLAIESALEDRAAKEQLLVELESRLTSGAILASNTSSLSIIELGAALKRPEQFLALHFFNPATVMKLVEVGVSERTAPGVIDAANRFCERIGKEPIAVSASPGYVVNRLLVPYLLQAVETLEAGIAAPEAIDRAMVLGCGHPMGPLALADFIGLDVVIAMAGSLRAELRDERYRVPLLLQRLVDRGQLGRKTGLGIFDYTGSEPRTNPMVEGFARGESVEVADAAE